MMYKQVCQNRCPNNETRAGWFGNNAMGFTFTNAAGYHWFICYP